MIDKKGQKDTMNYARIENGNKASQTARAGLNLGGPTSIQLDTAEIEFNLIWAERYEQLNAPRGSSA